MDTALLNNVVQVTTDYDRFSFMQANRDVNRNHIEDIKASFEEHGSLTRVQPVLVNERLQVIDGQHRFQACKELEEPIFYTVVDSIGIHQARSMNILHRRWSVADFAKSYSEEGRRGYIEYNMLKDEYPQFSHSIILIYATGAQTEGRFAEFHRGNFAVKDLALARHRLDMLDELFSVSSTFATKALARALLKAMENEHYDHDRMVQKATELAPEIKSFQNVDDNLRQLETIYNHKRMGENRIRFF